MSNELPGDLKLLLFWALTREGEFTKSEAGSKARVADINEILIKPGLLDGRKKGSALQLKANDRTWEWASSHLHEEFPWKSRAALGFLNLLRQKTAAYLECESVPLAELWRSRLVPSATQSVAPGLSSESLRALLFELGGGQYATPVRLRAIRARLDPHYPRAGQDELLLDLVRQGWIEVWPNDNPQDLTPEDDAARLDLGDRRRDLVYLRSEPAV